MRRTGSGFGFAVGIVIGFIVTHNKFKGGHIKALFCHHGLAFRDNLLAERAGGKAFINVKGMARALVCGTEG